MEIRLSGHSAYYTEYHLVWIPKYFAGARPKLQGQGEGFSDYGIRGETDQGLPGLINLIGIELPGLTASPAIAKYVAEIVAEKFS